jgi:hypothetical protein
LLVLDLVRPAGPLVRRLTPPGGARDLLPGEYAYTLPRTTLARLARGTYRFRARAWAPGGGPPRTLLSPSFDVR